MTTKSLPNFIENEDDFEYEEKVLRNPYELKPWWLYIYSKRTTSTPEIVNILYERALKTLPGSYKLWWNYLQDRVTQIRDLDLNDPSYESVIDAFERSLVTMHKMPRIWLDYCDFLMRQQFITRTRKTFDRALQSLPITQHSKIWKLYLEFAKKPFVPPETRDRIMERYLKLEPTFVESYIEELLEMGFYDKACIQLTKLVNSQDFRSVKKQTKYDLWTQLCGVFASHPDQIHSVPVDAIIRSGIKKYPSEVGDLWCSLATFYVHRGSFEQAFDIYEEAMTKVSTVKDFSQVFSSYSKLCDEIVEAKVTELQGVDIDSVENEEAKIDLEMRIAKYEYLMDRRPLLLNAVKLRQNPHNVHEWHKRATLLTDPEDVVAAYTDAVRTVETDKAVGKPFTLWSSFAKYYERNYKDLHSARTIFEGGIQILMKDANTSIEDMATLWCEYAEIEIKHKNFFNARNILQRATTQPKRNTFGRESGALDPVGDKLYKSIRLWSFYADLEESMGTLESTTSVYDRIIDLKIATPRIILNYGKYLEELHHFEDAFKAYERGISLFQYPQVFHICVTYLTKFTKRYAGRKLERGRDLFEMAIHQVPKEFAQGLYLLYAKYEEDYGLAKLAMNVYERAITTCQDSDCFDVYCIYINRASEYFGVTKTRDIYEKAIANLPDKAARDMGIRYADLECKLGEVDRARAIYAHISKFCDPRVDSEFWKLWENFEKAHGNIETFKEMLRVRRSVQATLSTGNVMTTGMLQAHKENLIQQQKKRNREGEIVKAAPSVALLQGNIEALEKQVTSQEVNPDEIQI